MRDLQVSACSGYYLCHYG